MEDEARWLIKMKFKMFLSASLSVPRSANTDHLDISEDGPNAERTEEHLQRARMEQRVSPVKVSVQGLTPAKRLDVPKSEIFRTPL